MASYLGLGLIAAAVYLPSLFGFDYFSDDQGILLATDWTSLWKLWTSSYVPGLSAVHYYRPALTTTFYFLGLTLPWARLVNILLHAGSALLLRANLRRRMSEEAAWAAALFWALSPMHVEAVVQLSGRSELLAGACLWGAWLALDTGRRGLGLALFTTALLSKESSFFFPLFYALAGERRRRERPWLALPVAAVLGARLAFLPSLIRGGAPYFDSHLIGLLTVPRFWLQRYLVPSLTGFGDCVDYSRPLIPDATTPVSLAVVVAVLSMARRRWELAFAAFLLPVSHVLMPIDTIGAQRWLYLPLAGLAAVLARWPRFTIVLAAYLGAHTVVRASAYSSAEGYYRAAASCNPGSARAWSSWGGAALQRGDKLEGRRRLERALSIQPDLPTPHYNLARLAYEEKRWKDAEAHITRALELQPGDPDAQLLADLIKRKK